MEIIQVIKNIITSIRIMKMVHRIIADMVEEIILVLVVQIYMNSTKLFTEFLRMISYVQIQFALRLGTSTSSQLVFSFLSLWSFPVNWTIFFPVENK